jgi:hypothetical protein
MNDSDLEKALNEVLNENKQAKEDLENKQMKVM